MSDRIFLIQSDSSRKPQSLDHQPYCLESELHELLIENPNLIDGEIIDNQSPRKWIRVKAEKGIAASNTTREQWSLDLLLLDQDGIPTLVEVKLAKNREIRREIVGQLLEYAANSVDTWDVERLRKDFEGRFDGDENRAAEFIGKQFGLGEEFDYQAYWNQVRLNLDGRRIRLLIVADAIPQELRHIVEFLNDEMPRIDLYAVEIKQFRNIETNIFVPQLVTRPTIQKVSSREKHSRDSFLAQFDTAHRDAIDKLLSAAKEEGAKVNLGTSGLSIRTPTLCKEYSVAWLYPPGVTGWMGIRGLAFGMGDGAANFKRRTPRGIFAVLESWLIDAEGLSGEKRVSQKEPQSIWLNPEQFQKHHVELIELMKTTISRLQGLSEQDIDHSS